MHRDDFFPCSCCNKPHTIRVYSRGFCEDHKKEADEFRKQVGSKCCLCGGVALYTSGGSGFCKAHKAEALKATNKRLSDGKAFGIRQGRQGQAQRPTTYKGLSGAVASTVDTYKDKLARVAVSDFRPKTFEQNIVEHRAPIGTGALLRGKNGPKAKPKPKKQVKPKKLRGAK